MAIESTTFDYRDIAASYGVYLRGEDKMASETTTRNETALSDLNQRIHAASQKVVLITANLREKADAAFGGFPEGTENEGDRPCRSGAMGSAFDNLDILAEQIAKLETQAQRFDYLV